ncbi:MAG: hypothetical protein HZA48_12430 [Planctomycetes bacterium]|nr:hypothetical protein [Planctomycetota bacterium]
MKNKPVCFAILSAGCVISAGIASLNTDIIGRENYMFPLFFAGIFALLTIVFAIKADKN